MAIKSSVPASVSITIGIIRIILFLVRYRGKTFENDKYHQFSNLNLTRRRAMSQRHRFTILATAVVCLIAAGDATLAQQHPATSVVHPVADGMAVDAQQAFLSQYCTGCHNDTAKVGGMTLKSLDLVHPDQSAELAEKVIKKLRTGLMPPATATKRPPLETAKLFRTT